jgi:hypothetical protein
LVVLVAFERLLNLLHFDPFVKGIDHLKLLLVNFLQGLFFFLEKFVKLPYFNVAPFKDRLELISLLLAESFVLPDGKYAFCFSEAKLEVAEFLKHLLGLRIGEGIHCIAEGLLMSCSNLLKVKGKVISSWECNLCMIFCT